MVRSKNLLFFFLVKIKRKEEEQYVNVLKCIVSIFKFVQPCTINIEHFINVSAHTLLNILLSCTTFPMKLKLCSFGSPFFVQWTSLRFENILLKKKLEEKFQLHSLFSSLISSCLLLMQKQIFICDIWQFVTKKLSLSKQLKVYFIDQGFK